MKLNVYHSNIEKKRSIKKDVMGEEIQIVEEIQKYSIVESKPEYLIVKDNEAMVQVSLHDIYAIETIGRDNIIFTKDKEFKTDLTLSSFIEIYYSYNFFRISRSCIINLDYITSMIPTYNMKMKIKLKNGSSKYVTRSYLNNFRERIGMWGVLWIKCI